MTLHEPDLRRAHLAALPQFAGAAGLLRPLTAAAGIYAASIALLGIALLGSVLAPAAWQPGLAVLRQTGAGGAVIAALILALGAALCCRLMVGRRHRAVLRAAGLARPPQNLMQNLVMQNLVIIGTAAAAVAALWLPRGSDAAALPATATWFALAGVDILAAFPLLVAERVLDATADIKLPERKALAALARLPIGCLVLLAGADLLAGLGLDLSHGAAVLLGAGVALVAAELAARALAALLRPERDRTAERAPVDSVLLGVFAPAIGRPQRWPAVLRARFGLDFARSWALRYLRRAMLPVLASLALVCVFLTGVTRIDASERGIYQRLGVPVAVLRPGLHVLLPWPLGRVRRTEYGVVHAVPVSYGDADMSSDALLQALAAGPAATDATATEIEGPAPAEANRLWDAEQSSDVSYIISSDSRGRQSFETISVSVRVLWRVGLDDAAARHAVAAVVDHDVVVRTLASQFLARHLASRTLPQILGEDRAGITRGLQSGLQAMLDRIGAGIEVVSVIVEAIHPPGGAAVAYRNVQAAAIAADTAIAAERGRAQTTVSLARRDVAEAVGAATAAAAERLAAAAVVRTEFRADAAAYRASGGPFLLERYLGQLATSLRTAAVEILDHRLGAADGPTLDLRPFERIGEAGPPHGNRAADTGDTP